MAPELARDRRTQRAARVVGIVLAAGRGERFGGDKLMAPLTQTRADIPAGTPLALAACRHVIAALPETIVVVRAGATAIESVVAGTGAVIVRCPDADAGMSATLACGVRARANADGWVIALGDMPWIDPRTIRSVARAVVNGAPVAAPFFNGRRGHPVGFGSALRDALLALGGDQGARDIVQAHEAALMRIDVDDPGILRDVDTPADL
ncbi:MAG TPA: nucleotidyltransferase family protein [Casimicrobiaceae bacterium]|nr:nucleotidyltransferase family protein [Casimicrobiaceae bacterium]